MEGICLKWYDYECQWFCQCLQLQSDIVFCCTILGSQYHIFRRSSFSMHCVYYIFFTLIVMYILNSNVCPPNTF